MREKQIEQKLVKAVKAEGGMCPKLISPGTDGMPDRLVMLPKARIGFVEVKAPGAKPRPLQVKRLGQLQDLSTSNMTTKRLAEELVQAHDYEVLPVEHPEGEHMIGADGFMEFHMKEGEAVQWVLEHMYSRE